MAVDEQIKKDAFDFLKKHHVAVLSTIAADGRPQAAAVTYVVDDDWNLYFVTKRHTRKFQNLEQNKNVAIVVGSDPATPATIQMHGEAILSDGKATSTILKIAESAGMTGQLLYWWPMLKAKGFDFVVFKVKITWLRWLNLSPSKDPELYREDYYQIIP